jgi:hypothetical protein
LAQQEGSAAQQAGSAEQAGSAAQQAGSAAQQAGSAAQPGSQHARPRRPAADAESAATMPTTTNATNSERIEEKRFMENLLGRKPNRIAFRSGIDSVDRVRDSRVPQRQHPNRLRKDARSGKFGGLPAAMDSTHASSFIT